MRKRHLIGTAVAVTALAGTAAIGGAIAYAEDDDHSQTRTAATEVAGTGTVVLPTGDTVRLAPGGGVDVTPAPGREDVGFIGRTSTDGSGDLIVVPDDMVDSIRSGEADTRRYDVSQLLADGHTDAAAIPESELGPREYAGLVPVADPAEASAETRTLTVSVNDRAGEVPDDAVVSWVKAGTDEAGDIPIGADGTGTAELEPGEYLIMTILIDAATETERGETVLGFTSATVGDGPAELTIDAGTAAPVSVEVEREGAVLEDHMLYLDAEQEEGAGQGIFDFLDAGNDAYVLPQPETDAFEINFLYEAVLSGPADAAEPFDYTLAITEPGSIPADATYTVADADLAVEATEYQDLGVDLAGRQCDYPTAWEGQVFLFGQCDERAFPSRSTNLYTPAPVLWDRTTEAGLFNEDGYATSEIAASLEAGPSERVIGDGPLSAGVPWAVRSGDLIAGSITPVASHAGETLRLVGFTSESVVLSRDGEKLGSSETLGDFTFQLPEGDEGRYTLTAEAARGTDATPLGVESTLEWAFDSAGGGEDVLDLPVVFVESDAVQSGWAERDEPQEITLTLDSDAQEAESLCLEVSYDDGATWTEAELDGDTATLDHSDDAAFVSLRITAADTAGTEVTQTTIRSFGLR